MSDNTTANEAPPIRQLSAPELKALIESGAPIGLVDVRNLYNLRGGIDAWSLLVDTSVPRMRAEAVRLNVLYEDDHLLALDKLAGVVVHPGYGHAEGTVLNALLWHARGWSATQRPSIVGRLDKLTSGIVIVAKTSVNLMNNTG